MAIKIDREWLKELKGQKPSFSRALWEAHKVEYAKSFLYFLLLACSKTLIPITLGWFIDWFANDGTLWVLVSPEHDGYIYGLLFVIVSFSKSLILAPLLHDQMVKGNALQVQACSIVYKKLLRLNQNGSSKISIGKIINIMSSDVMRYNLAVQERENFKQDF